MVDSSGDSLLILCDVCGGLMSLELTIVDGITMVGLDDRILLWLVGRWRHIMCRTWVLHNTSSVLSLLASQILWLLHKLFEPSFNVQSGGFSSFAETNQDREHAHSIAKQRGWQLQLQEGRQGNQIGCQWWEMALASFHHPCRLKAFEARRLNAWQEVDKTVVVSNPVTISLVAHWVVGEREGESLVW